MKKIIYFDESSATDILLMEYGGQITKLDAETGTIHLKGKAGIEAEVGAGTGILNIVKAAFSLKSTIHMPSEKDSIVKKTISNTILTDFLEISPDLVKKNTVSKLIGYQLQAVPNSFTFIKMYAPYFKMLNDDFDMDNQLKGFNLHKVNDVLMEAKGYYELLAISKNNRAVFRFNINSFKNAYYLTDLPRMNLEYLATEVGECLEADLDITNEMMIQDKKNNFEELDVENIVKTKGREYTNSSKLKLYDVILAGVGE